MSKISESIREQEAVKAKIRTIIALDNTPWVSHEARTTCYQRHLGELILATRDAIARQMREEATRRDREGTISDRADKKVWFRAATFIEGLNV